MKRKTKAKLNSAALAVILSVPLIYARVQADNKPEEGVRKPTEQEIEMQIVQNTATEPQAEVEVQTWEYVALADTEEVTTAPTFKGYDFIPLSVELQVQIFTICEEYEIAYELILSVMKTESEFQWLIGDNGHAVGYMQIQPQWWQGLADEMGLNINEPLDNVHLGTIILKQLLVDNGGDLAKALKQYNSGNPDYPGNEYIDKVYSNYEWIEAQKAGEGYVE